MAICDIWSGNRSPTCSYNWSPPYSLSSLLHNQHRDSPEQLQSSQHGNITSVTCGQNLLAELNEYSKTCPKTGVGKRTQIEHLGYSTLTKLCDGDQVCVSPHCAPSPEWPSLSHPFSTTQQHFTPCLATTLAPTPSCSQLSCAVLSRKGKEMDMTNSAFIAPNGQIYGYAQRGTRKTKGLEGTQWEDQWLYGESFFPASIRQLAHRQVEGNVWIQGDVSDVLGNSPPGPSWAAEICLNSSMFVNSICFLGVNKTQADVPNIY